MWLDPSHDLISHRNHPKQASPACFAEKLQRAIERGYFEEGEVLSLIAMLNVPKGPDDAALRDPYVLLQTGASFLRLIIFASFMMDTDIGEMFLNFPMHRRDHPYAGIYIQHFKKGLKGNYLNKLGRILR
jgi:hypothetical protein